MAADEGISTKVSVLGDKEYKKALQSIGKGLTALNTEMKASQEAFGNQKDSLEGLRDKHSKLTGIYDEQAKKVKLISEQLNKAKTEYDDNSTQVESLQVALRTAQAQLRRTANSIKQTEEGLTKMEKAVAESDDKSAAYSLTLREVEKSLDKEGDAADEAEDDNSRLADAMGKAGDVAKGAMKAGLEAAAAAIVALSAAALAGAKEIAQLGTDYQQATNQLSAQTGATGQELEELGSIAQAVYKNNFGENIGDVNEALATTKVNTGLMGDELQKATESGYLLRDTFGMDFAESSRAAAALMNKFGISGEEAYNLIAVGAQKGANQNGDLLDVLSEYAPKYAEMGLTADDMMNTLIAGAENGVFQIDKVGDAVKEFSIRAIDGSDSTKDAFDKLGLKASYISAEIAEGGPQARNAFLEVVGALEAVEDPLERNQLAVALFGTQFEDLGEQALPILASIAENGEITTDALGQINAVKYDDAATALEGVKRSIEAEFLPLAETMNSRITETLNGISTALADGFQPEDIVTIGNDVAASLMEGIESLGTLIAENKETFSAFASQLTGLIAEALPGLVDSLLPAAKELLQAVLDAVTENAEAIGGMAGDLVGEIVKFLVENAPGMVDAAGDILGGLIDGLLDEDNLAKLVPAAIDMIGKLATSLVENAGELLLKAPEIIGQLVQGLLDTDWLKIGKDLLQGLADGMKAAGEAIKDTLLAPFQSVVDWIKDLLGIHSPSTVLEEIGGFLLDGLGAGLEAGVDAVCDIVENVFGRIWDAIKSIFGFGGESEESKEAKDAGQDIMTGLKQGIVGGEEDMKTAVKNAAKAALDTFKTELGVAEGNSTKTKPMGESVAKGLNDGLSSATADTFKGGATTLADAVASAINAAFGVEGTGFLGMGEQSAKKFEAIGAAACKAIADGITSNNANTEAVKTAITGVANTAYETAVAEMDTGITGGTETVNAAVDAVATAALEAAADILNNDAGGDIGKDFMDGLKRAVQRAKSSLASTATQTAKGGHDAAKQELSTANGQRIGVALAQGIRAGIDGESHSVSGTARSLGSGALSALWGAVGSGGSKFEAIGNAISQGVARGIQGGSSRIQSAAREAARSAYNAAKKELGIASPSKRMAEIGEYYDQGFAEGIEQGMNRVLRAAKRLSAIAAEETAQGGRGRTQGEAVQVNVALDAPEIDYERLGNAVADSFIRKGIERTVITMNGRIVGQTVEPDVSRASYRRAQHSAKGRASRLVFT